MNPVSESILNQLFIVWFFMLDMECYIDVTSLYYNFVFKCRCEGYIVPPHLMNLRYNISPNKYFQGNN